VLVGSVSVAGVVLETARSKYAKWINIGFWLLLAAYYLLGAVMAWSDPFGPLLLLMGVTLLIPAGINYLLYRNQAA
jgi:hypothetical protein